VSLTRAAQHQGPPFASRRWAFVRRAVARLRPLGPPAAITAALALVPFNTCLLKRALGVPCPGCGFTRALLALARGDVRASLGLHPLALPGVALGAVAVVLAIALPDGHPAWDRFARRALTFCAAALCVA
jgi:hypothetical protein